MRNLKATRYFLGFLLFVAFLPLNIFAADQLPHFDTYVLSPSEYKKLKSMLDDPKDLVVAYVLQMTQMDPNYVYSKRILYVDKESFGVQFSAAYDQRGRLYRSQFMNYVFFPQYGMISQYGTMAVQTDHIDNHATAQAIFPLPGIFSRKDFTIEEMVKKGK